MFRRASASMERLYYNEIPFEKKTEIICQELELSTTNYWQIIHRAKLQLRHCLENKWFRKEENQKK
jgi:hypothetical protein